LTFLLGDDPMPRYYVRETFFRPPEHLRELSALPATLYNNLSLMLKRSGSESLFIPIRSMQFQAVVERREIVFVDSQGGYAHRDGEGGRLIRIAWRPAQAVERGSLNNPVPCEIVYYFPGLREVQRRLMSDFPPVLETMLQRRREEEARSIAPRVLPLRRDI
jgi:hypothetical protein